MVYNSVRHVRRFLLPWFRSRKRFRVSSVRAVRSFLAWFRCRGILRLLPVFRPFWGLLGAFLGAWCPILAAVRGSLVTACRGSGPSVRVSACLIASNRSTLAASGQKYGQGAKTRFRAFWRVLARGPQFVVWHLVRRRSAGGPLSLAAMVRRWSVVRVPGPLLKSAGSGAGLPGPRCRGRSRLAVLLPGPLAWSGGGPLWASGGVCGPSRCHSQRCRV